MMEVAHGVGATELWAEGITGAGVDVTIIGTGIAPVRGLDRADVVVGPDLSFDAGSEALTGLDSYGHGTHMAGIIGARTPRSRSHRCQP